MTKITADTVRQMAKLAHLKLSDDEIEKFQTELASILDYVKMLDKVDTTGIEPTAQVTGLTNVTRPDSASDYGASPEDLLRAAPDEADGYIKVRRVL